MDLSEVRGRAAARHPWEVARAEAIVSILKRSTANVSAVLDYGCGDSFTGLAVKRAFSARELVGIDAHLPAELCGRLNGAEGTVELARNESTLEGRKFDLLLLCDVIEHVEDDRAFLRGIVGRRMSSGSRVLVTVPAFQVLFSEHDRALNHYRRYSLKSLQSTLIAAGLELTSSGYLFGSLLIPRMLTKLGERMGYAKRDHGIGHWGRGATVTSLLTRALGLDNRILLGARRLGLTLPGLTAWASCRTR